MKPPLDKLQAGREKEIASLTAFDAFGEIDEYSGKVWGMIRSASGVEIW